MSKSDKEKLNKKINLLLAVSLFTTIGLGGYAHHIEDTLSDREELRDFENFMKQSYQISGAWPTNLEIKSKGLLSRYITTDTELKSSYDINTGIYSIFLNDNLFYSFISTPTMADLKLVINEKLSHQQNLTIGSPKKEFNEGDEKVDTKESTKDEVFNRVYTNIPDLMPKQSTKGYITSKEALKRLGQLSSGTLTEMQEETVKANMAGLRIKAVIEINDTEVYNNNIQVETSYFGKPTFAFFEGTDANLNTFVLINKGEKITIDCNLDVGSVFNTPFLRDCKLIG